MDKHVKEKWMWIYWESHFQYSVSEMRISLWCSTPTPLDFSDMWRQHYERIYNTMNAFQTTLPQHVGYCIDPCFGKEDKFFSEHFQKAWAVCVHIQAMPLWPMRGTDLQCYRLCLVCSRGEAWQQRREILSYRSFLCSSHKIATFWSKRVYLKGVCCMEGKSKLMCWAVSFLPNL